MAPGLTRISSNISKIMQELYLKIMVIESNFGCPLTNRTSFVSRIGRMLVCFARIYYKIALYFFIPGLFYSRFKSVQLDATG